MKTSSLLLAFQLFLLFSASAQTPSFITDSLDRYINQGLRDWELPGLSIVVVKDGKVVVMKGYGVRSVTAKEPVDENTLFMIASNTKLFTGTALALLDYRKKISLDDKIVKYFPDYRLYDSNDTRILSIRDLLSHRIGTKTFQGDFSFWNTTHTRSEIMYKMRYLKPVSPFRQTFGYCNSCFMTAGQVIPKVTGKPWEVFVYDSLIVPLHMRSTRVSSTGYGDQPNLAVPYTNSFTGKLTQVPYDNWDNLGPAASIVSNVNDLSHWLLFQLDSGKYNNTRIVPFEVLQKTRDINTIISTRRARGLPINFVGYGLGIFSASYNGKQIFYHTGGAAGIVSNVCFVPEERLGIAILTNNDNQNFFEALRYQILDAYLGVPYVNRSKQQLPGFYKEMKEQEDATAAWRSRVNHKKPALALNAYTGVYANTLYGTINISAVDDHLLIKFNSHAQLTATLEYMDNNEWLLQFNDLEYGIFSTKFAESGNSVKSVTIKVNDYVEYDPYVFEKK